MAVENLIDRAFLNNAHEQGFTVEAQGGGFANLTGRHVKWSMSVMDEVGVFDASIVAAEKTNQTPGDMTDVDLTNGEIDVNLMPADTIALAAGDYHFQLEVFDTMGLNGVVVSAGTITFVLNLLETV